MRVEPDFPRGQKTAPGPESVSGRRFPTGRQQFAGLSAATAEKTRRRWRRKAAMQRPAPEAERASSGSGTTSLCSNRPMRTCCCHAANAPAVADFRIACFAAKTQPVSQTVRAVRASVPIESERRLYFLVLTRFLHANRYPLRWKTL